MKDNNFYPTLSEAADSVRKMDIYNIDAYKKYRYLDPKLPPDPDILYSLDWTCWFDFFERECWLKYETLEEASQAAIDLGIKNFKEYKILRIKDFRLPKYPNKCFKEWRGCKNFLLPNRYECLADVKKMVKILDIKNSAEYRQIYKEHPSLPAHPERKFKDEWVNWYDLCDIPRPYSYEEAKKLIAKQGISTRREYLDYIIRTGDPRLPRTPDQVYQRLWINWHVYLGTKEPYRIKNIRAPYLGWAECIGEFLKSAKGGKTKESHLCRFVRYFIQAYEMGESPQIFLTLAKKDIRPFKAWLDDNETKVIAHKILVSVNEFLDYVITHYLTDEDEETGELVVVRNTHNPFSNLSVDCSSEPNRTPGESVKHALAYQYVNAARQWIIPIGANNFSDLGHLQKFNSDWFDVDSKLVDISDANCVTRSSRGKLQIWFPVFWLHTYALMSVPARGRQLAYCDSGEADKLIPTLDPAGTIKWIKNSSSLAGLTSAQGFVKYYEGEEVGMHFTTNKTSFNGQGYSVAWMPESLAYWMILLRQWQSKYNPVSRPMPWFECEKTSLNEQQRIAKGSNCFLFREFGGEEPGHFSGRLATRLAASIYNTQPSGLLLATLSDDENILGHYSSRYTPHSMRVSLITAYIEEFRLPLHIIMKVAGHSSVVMTIYYCKIGSEDLRHRFSEGEKVAMQSKSYAAQRMIEQGRIDEIKNELIATSEDALNLISNHTPVGNYLFRDYGICPYGGTRCSDGGDIIQNSKIRSSVSIGYLGSQNCIACRHFITGPAFSGGLLSLGNEISFASHLQYEQCSDLTLQAKRLNQKINELDDEAYDIEALGGVSSEGKRNALELQKRKTLSESEAADKKMDALLCDMNKASKLIKQCQALVNSDAEEISDLGNSARTKLIVQQDHELDVCYEETSLFRQLSEVCENAEIYQSASSEMALAPRSQCLDRMALRNGVPMHMFTLDKKQQLAIGNQVTKLMLDRLKSWGKVDDLIDGRICLEDLSPEEHITKQELSILFQPKEEFIKNDRDNSLEEFL